MILNQGHLALSGDILSKVRADATGISYARENAKYPTMHREALHNKN